MRFYELLKFSFMNLWRRKLRTSLTLLGVMIGTASIVVMMSLGIGLNHSYIKQIEDSGTLTLITVNNYGGGMGMGGGMAVASIKGGPHTDSTSQLKLDKDAITSFKNIEHVTKTSPVYEFSVLAQFGKYQANLNINALEYDMLTALNLPVLKGELPRRGDPLTFIAGSKVGFNFYDPKGNTDMMWGEQTEPTVDLYDSQLFVVYDMDKYYQAQSDPKIKMPKKYLMNTSALLGVESTEYGWSQYDYNVYADLGAVEDTFQKVFKKHAWPNQPVDKKGKPVNPMTYNSAYVLVDDINNVAAVQKTITDMGFQASSDMDYLKSMQEQSKMIQYVLAGIGSVSLLVAAIGIANTMLMSIFERTKEIGIFKVLGCSLGNIRSMFLTEAALIGFSGGTLGLVLSLTLSKIINLFIGEISVVPFWLAMLGLGFAVIVGMVAGLSPAIRATKLSPLEAIRTL
ncbi:MAG: ABC transporter permease [Oscillospiraceae bacterium]